MDTNLKIKQGKGVLSKDKTPYAPATLHVVETNSMGNWMIPIKYSPESLLNALVDPKIEQVHLITEDNVEYIVTS